MRVFVAIPVPEELKQYSYNIKKELDSASPDVKWVEYENYHITLKFLGNVDPALVDDIKEKLALAGESCPQFYLNLKGLGFFPSKTRPRVIWLGIEGQIKRAFFLGERIDAYLSGLGFEEEKKRSFHFTLGRIRSDKNIDKLLAKAAGVNGQVESSPFLVSSFNLMESHLSSKGATYIIKEKFVLSG